VNDDNELAGVVARAVKQLEIALGEEPARALVAECLSQLGIATPATMADLVALSRCLVSHGGFAEVVGRSLRHHALQRGYGA
jgi:hypothetical protein